jgi:ADP-ribose pyrophosphatase
MSEDHQLLNSEPVFRGKVITLLRDTIAMGDDDPAVREVVEHTGAVGVVALDEQDRIVMVNQYRHPVRARLDELPAGLLDVDGEPPLDAARRELAEEAALQADEWHVLLDLHTSPGFSNEAIRIFLARGLTEVGRPADFVVEHEEVGMTLRRVPLDDAVSRALAGDITNAAAVAGILAAGAARARGWRDLRPVDAPWPGRARPRS